MSIGEYFAQFFERLNTCPKCKAAVIVDAEARELYCANWAECDYRVVPQDADADGG
jgi:hypothetical protein